jgi:hypothetical protein
VLSEQFGGPRWRRYFSYPVTQVVLVVTELELGVFGFPSLAVGDDGQVVYIADDEVLIEAAIQLRRNLVLLLPGSSATSSCLTQDIISSAPFIRPVGAAKLGCC